MPTTLPDPLYAMANTAAVLARGEQFLTEAIADRVRTGLSMESVEYKRLARGQDRLLDQITEARDYLTDMFDHFHVWEAAGLTENPS